MQSPYAPEQREAHDTPQPTTDSERRFDRRRKYDAAKVLTAFQRSVRDETDLERLTAELLRVVDETMQPESVGLWLRDTQMHGMPKSTSPNST
jgi:hypothetical protein